MIVCERYRFVYVSPPKTASTSLHHWLSQPAFCVERWTPDKQDQHNVAIPAEAAGFYCFASVRNPYSRAISLWQHSQRGGRRDGGLPEMIFAEFLEWIEGPGVPRFYRAGQAEILANVRLDGLVRIEALARDLRQLPWIDRLDPTVELEEIPHRNRTAHRPWPSYFPSTAPGHLPGALAATVHRMWAEDFERFGYGGGW